MIAAATAYSKSKIPAYAAESAVTQALTKAGVTKADVVLFFVSTKYRRHYDKILQKIKEISGASTILGASGHGILTEETDIERQCGIAVMVLASDKLRAASFLVSNLQESNFRAGELAARTLKEQMHPRLALIFPDPFSFQTPLFLDGFESVLGYVPMIGGAAAEDGREYKTYQMNHSQVAFDSVCGLGLEGDFRFETGLTRSCRPFGEALKITRAEGNAIYEMDGRPAYDILLESISHIDQDPQKLFKNIFLGIPLKNFQTEFTGDNYLVRNIMNVNSKNGMLTCTSPVEEGEFVTFAVRDPNLARQDLKDMLEDLKHRLGTSKPVMGFYFNCCARGELLYGKKGEDIALIRQYFPQVPILGFFSYGEFAPVDFVNHLHHHSGVLTLIAPS